MEYLGTNKPVNGMKPLVSVCVITYNHGKYIRRCLDSILSQKTNFHFEVIIGEDESTDGTREICKQYAEQYPDHIRLFLRERKDVIYINKKPTGRFNFIETMKAARGKYIALCEGDDFWCYKRKLFKQIRFLEKNIDYGAIAHNIIKRRNGWNYPSRYRYNFDINTKDLLKSNMIPTCSVVYRKSMLPSFDERIYADIPMADWPTHVFVSLKGKIKRLWNYWSVYRIHSGGIYSNLDEHHRLQITLYSRELMCDYLPNCYRTLCDDIINTTKIKLRIITKEG